MLLSASFALLFAAMIVPAGVSILRRRVPTPLAAYFFGIAFIYVLPYFYRDKSVFPAGEDTYAKIFLLLSVYCLVLLFAYCGFGLPLCRSLESPHSPRTRVLSKMTRVLTLVAVLVGPLAIVSALIVGVGAGRMVREFLAYGNDSVRRHLSTVGPLVVLLYPLNGAFIYQALHVGFRSPARMKSLLMSALWMFVTFLTGERHMVVLVVATVALIKHVRGRTRYAVMAFILAALFLIGYSVLFKNSARQEIESSGPFGYFARSIDRLWPLAWAVETSRVTATESSVMPQGAGWRYAALAYIPRSVYPDKGYDTTRYLAYAVSPTMGVDPGGESVAEVDWGIAVGGPAEGLFNLGYLGVALEGLFCGAVLHAIRVWLKRRGDLVLAAFMFWVVILSTQITLFTQATLFVPSVLGYVLMSASNVSGGYKRCLR